MNIGFFEILISRAGSGRFFHVHGPSYALSKRLPDAHQEAEVAQLLVKFSEVVIISARSDLHRIMS